MGKIIAGKIIRDPNMILSPVIFQALQSLPRMTAKTTRITHSGARRSRLF